VAQLDAIVRRPCLETCGLPLSGAWRDAGTVRENSARPQRSFRSYMQRYEQTQ